MKVSLPVVVLAFVLPGVASTRSFAQEPVDTGEWRTTVSQVFSAGGMVRVLKRDPGLVGGGNGGTGTSINFDDGNLNHGRGLTAFGMLGRTMLEVRSGETELRLEGVYFYDFVNGDGRTDFRPLPAEARRRAGRDAYFDELFVGHGHATGIARFRVRAGSQVLRWSESPSFGHAIAPVNPVSASRRYQPGYVARDSYVALPMLTWKVEWPAKGHFEGFYLLGFRPTELEAAGTFLGGNDYYAPGGRYLQLGQGSPLVADTDASVVTPATPFGSRVPRAPDRLPGADGQYGARIESAALGTARVSVAGYAMRVHSREPVVSLRTGTLGGLLRAAAPDYTSSGSYFVEHPRGVTVLGAAARSTPTASTRFTLEYSRRLRQPLQIDDDLLIAAGLAPAAAVAACAPDPAGALCAATLAALNRNRVIALGGGITAGNAARLFSIEIPGYERFDVSQHSASVAQGLPPILHAARWTLAGEVGGLRVHGFREGFLDASVSIRPDGAGARRRGLATRSSSGYRLSTRLDYANVLGMASVSPSLTWIADVRGNAPITLGTLLQGIRSAIFAVDIGVSRRVAARVSYRSFLGKGSDADRFSDRDFVSFSLTRTF